MASDHFSQEIASYSDNDIFDKQIVNISDVSDGPSRPHEDIQITSTSINNDIVNDDDTDGNYIFRVDHSIRGTAKCKKCNKIIAKGVLRIGKSVLFKDKYILQYFHIKCAFEMCTRARLPSNVIDDVNKLGGVELLSVSERQELTNLVLELKTNREKIKKIKQPSMKKSMIIRTSTKARIKTMKSSNIPSLKIMFTNADQLTTSKMTELKKKIESEKPLIIAVCEVKPKVSKELDEMDYEIPGYTMHPMNLDKNIGRGIAVYTHSSLNKSTIQIDSDLSFEEVCLLELRLRGGDILLFGCCYRSPTKTASSDENNNKLNRLLKCISKKKYSHRCLVGDFNFRKINWSTWTTPCNEDSAEMSFIEAVRDSFFHQHIEQSTRSRGADEPSVLDLIFTDEQMQISDISHLAPLGKSDHSVITFNFHCYLDFTKPKDRYIYSKGDYDAMRSQIRNTEWNVMYLETGETMSVEELWKVLTTKITELRNLYVPKVSVSGNPSWRKKGNFPIDKGTHAAIQDKNKKHRIWMASKTYEDRNAAHAEYCKARNKVKTLLRKAKRSFEKNIALQAKTNPKLFWCHARSKLKTKRSVAPLLANLADQSTLKFDDLEKANILQQQFCSVFNCDPDGNRSPIPSLTDASIRNIIITEEMVIKVLNGLNVNKSIGPDEIHPRLLVELADEIAGPLALLFNKSIEHSCLPCDWKNAYISPIYKNGSKSNPENYRPISLTCILSKIMESFVREKILKHLLDEKLLSRRQYGFITGRSTTIQLLHFLDRCVDIIANGGVVDTVYFDFSKAFDTVPHLRLLDKLKSYGISGAIFEWIKEFLCGRSQVVMVNGEKSIPASVVSGIPQGTVLGPLLFVVYINDILDSVSSDGLLFADDTKIFRRIASCDDALILQSDINSMEEWAKEWQLKFNLDKCHILTLGKFHNIMHTHRYSIYSNEIEHVFEEKDLGVILDSDLTFDEHISKKVQKANAIVGLIRRTFSFLDEKSFIKLYTSFVRPHLEYAQTVWSPHTMKFIDMLENVQIRATKLVDGLGNMEYSDRLRRLNLPTLTYRRIRGDMIEMFKHFKYYDRDILPPSFHPSNRPSRKHKFQLRVMRPNDGVRGVQTNAFYNRASSLWNDLPREVVNASNMDTFKNRLDDFWKNNAIKYDYKAGRTSMSNS